MLYFKGAKINIILVVTIIILSCSAKLKLHFNTSHVLIDHSFEQLSCETCKFKG